MTARFTMLKRDLLEIAGADCRTFLQGLISQDVEKVDDKQSAYGALLTPQGKFLHDFLMISLDSSLLLDCEAGRGEELAGRLRRFKLRADVNLELRPDLAVAAVYGEGAAQALEIAAVAGITETRNGITAFVDPRTLDLGVRALGAPDDLRSLMSEHAIVEQPFEDYDQLRIRLEVPDGSRDLD
ncbi:MAG: folate-binding protein, partial [Alphaproteobacteria bacterium]|nr:folate-binding protein [Alphaproteobacteria bacterium]